MTQEHFLPILPFERIAKRAGVTRLSRDGAEELREVIEELAIAISERATRVALHSGRKTVQREDVEFITGKVAPQALPTKSTTDAAKPLKQPEKEGRTATDAHK